MNIKNYILLSFFIAAVLALSHCSGDYISSNPTNKTTSTSHDYYSVGKNLFDEDQYSDAIEEFLLGLDQARKRKNLEDMSNYIYMIGLTYQRLTNYDLALEYLERLLEFPDAIIAPKRRASIFSTIANIYKEQGQYPDAHAFQQKALEISEEIDDIRGICRYYYDFGSIYFYQELYEKALEYYSEGKAKAEELDEPRILFTYLSAIGSVYDKLGAPETSLEYNLSSLEIAKKSERLIDLAYAFQNTGANYIELKRFDKAEKALLEALEMQEELENRFAEIGVLRDIGKLYTEIGDFTKAVDYLDHGLAISERIASKPRTAEIYKALSNTYQRAGESNKAIYFLKEHVAIRDSILNQQTLDLIADAQTSHLVQQREKEIVVLRKDQLISEQKVLMLFGFLAFVSVFLIIAFYSYRSQKHLNGALAEKNDQIQSQNAQLEKKNEQIQLQNQKLAEINHELKQFTSVASHDLRSPLRTITSFSNLLDRRYRENLDEQAQEYLQFIQTGTRRMMNMINDLLEYARLGKEEIPNEWMDSGEIVDEALFNLQENIRLENALIKVNQDKLPRIKANRMMMVRLFQNLVGNAIKFRSSQRPEVEIALVSGRSKLYLLHQR